MAFRGIREKERRDRDPKPEAGWGQKSQFWHGYQKLASSWNCLEISICIFLLLIKDIIISHNSIRNHLTQLRSKTSWFATWNLKGFWTNVDFINWEEVLLENLELQESFAMQISSTEWNLFVSRVNSFLLLITGCPTYCLKSSSAKSVRTEFIRQILSFF